MKEIFLPCISACEVLCVNFDDEDGELFLAMYEYGARNNQRHRIWNNIKDGIKLMFGKKVLISDIILDKDKQNELKKFLNEVIK